MKTSTEVLLDLRKTLNNVGISDNAEIILKKEKVFIDAAWILALIDAYIEESSL